METNESILTREIVSIDDRKRLGNMKDLCVDCDTLAVSHYIVNSSTTGSPLVLPFNKSLAVGDTFITIQNRDDFIALNDAEAQKIVSDGFRLVGAEVFSQNGNRLGNIEGFEFDTTHGKITKILLGRRQGFGAESFVFFSPDFVFVDDGASTAFEMRNGIKSSKGAKGAKASTAKKKPNPRIFSKGPSAEKPVAAKPSVVEEVKAEVKEAAAPVVKKAAAPKAAPKPAAKPVATPKAAPAPAAAAASEDDVLKEFLIGAVVNDEVVSKDGQFKVAKNTILTKEMIDRAEKHDALLLLIMSVES